MSYVTDTNVPDDTPPPAPTDVRMNNRTLTWNSPADLESGLSHFIIRRDGRFVARVPEVGKNRFGRPIFQGLQYSDTPTFPLAKMTFTFPVRESVGETQSVVSVNTQGLKSVAGRVE